MKQKRPGRAGRRAKIAAFAAIQVVCVIAAAVTYAALSKTQRVDVYMLRSDVPAGEVFNADDLFVTQLESPSVSVLESVVAVPEGGFVGSYTALQNLRAGSFLQPSYFAEGAQSEVLAVTETNIVLQENFVILPVSLPSLRSDANDRYIQTEAGVYQLITPTNPPRHIACVSGVQTGEGETTYENLRVASEDALEVVGWLAGGFGRLSAGQRESDVIAIKYTSDECPLGGQPVQCGIMFTGENPLAERGVDIGDSGLEITEEGEVILQEGVEEQAEQVRLPECLTTRDEGEITWQEFWLDRNPNSGDPAILGELEETAPDLEQPQFAPEPPEEDTLSVPDSQDGSL